MDALPGEKLIYSAYYSIGFVNDPRLMDEFENYEPNLNQFMSLKTLKEQTVTQAAAFIAMDIEDQRKLFADRGKKDRRKVLEDYIRSVCDIIRNIVSDTKLVKYFILLLDGMIEDDRERISILVNLQKATKGNKEDIIDMLKHYLVGAQSGEQGAKDVAAHVLSKLLTAKDMKNVEEEMKSFLSFLLSTQAARSEAEKPITALGFSSALANLLKVPELLQYFISSNGMQTLNNLLIKEREDKQVCYNALTCLWIITFKPYSRHFFEDRQNESIESIIKVLQLHGNEKIVRIILYIFKNLCASEKSIEYMLDCDLDKEVNKLLNRHWVDAEIQKNLTELEKVLNENYKVLNSYEKFKKQLSLGILKWGPVHNDTFWSEHFLLCEENEFDPINHLVTLLDTGNELTKAVACYDLGQFARYHPYGRLVLEKKGAKDKIIALMETSKNPEIREQALIAVQKMLPVSRLRVKESSGISDWQRIQREDRESARAASKCCQKAPYIP